MTAQRLQLDGPHRDRLLRQVYQLTLALLVIGLIASLLFFNKLTVWVVLSGCVLILLGDQLRQHGYRRLAQHLLLQFVALLITGLALIGEGSNDGVLLLFCPITIFAGLMLNRRHYWWYCSGLFAALALIGVAEFNGWVGYAVPVSTVQLWADLFIMLIGLACNALITDFILGGIGSFVVSVRDELEQESLNWHKAAMTDALTGLLNRRGFLDHAEWQLRRAKLDSTHVALLALDLDRFKAINDNYGHDAGDKVLQETAHRLQAHLRANDASGRMGGEEFCALLTGVGESDALQVADRFREALARLPVQVGDSAIAISVSIGLCAARAGELSLQELSQRADQALYQAKETGRNRVVIAANLPASAPDRRRQH